AALAGSGERAAMFCVTEALDTLESGFDARRLDIPYQARWARTVPRGARIVLEGHQGWVNAACPITIAGRELLATAGGDHSARIWDPSTATQITILEGHQGAVFAACPITIAGRELLATAGDDHSVRIWDPSTATQITILEGHQRAVFAACPITIAR